MRALIRTDASPTIGGGHAMRCGSLALALAARGWQGAFFCSASTAKTCPQVQRAGWPVAVLPKTELHNPSALADRADGPCDLLVVDSYALDAGYESACRPWAGAILAIDDLANRRHDCDYLLDQNLGRSAQDYSEKVPGQCEVFAGSRYALLQPAFAALRPKALARRQAGGRVERILVSFGLGDADNATGLVLEALAALRPSCRIDVVLGQAAPWRGEIERQLRGWRDARLLINVADMAGLMAETDLVIGAAGSSALERACLGLPSLLLIIADNQTDTAEELVTQGAARLCGTLGNTSAADIRDSLGDLLGDAAARRHMAAAAAMLCDGRGAERLSARLTLGQVAATKNVAMTR